MPAPCGDGKGKANFIVGKAAPAIRFDDGRKRRPGKATELSRTMFCEIQPRGKDDCCAVEEFTRLFIEQKKIAMTIGCTAHRIIYAGAVSDQNLL
mmetsp:Transcript_77168/g.136188  ORF Transcript_77168/g.136188 Transcript_77168/m.136188 type:complete len:95 (+) Transcript_77168:1138-1422(+)